MHAEMAATGRPIKRFMFFCELQVYWRLLTAHWLLVTDYL